MTDTPRPARRWLIESMVIVGSILLAFAIDAGWDELQEAGEERRFLETVDAEFESYAAKLLRSAEYQSLRADTVSWLLAQVGPDLDPALDEDRVWRAIARVLWTGNPRLDRSTLDALVESAGIQLLDDVEVRTQLIRWLQRREEIATLTEFNTTATDDLNEYLTSAGAFGRINLLSGGSGEKLLRETPFATSPRSLLQDPEFEGRLQVIELFADALSTRFADDITYLESARGLIADALR
jgi:hypothetical protein